MRVLDVFETYDKKRYQLLELTKSMFYIKCDWKLLRMFEDKYDAMETFVQLKRQFSKEN